MSEHESEQDETETGISDDQLPDDLVPDEDNPLAEGLEPGETVDDLLDGGKEPETSEDTADSEDSED